jgi:hypothetical protein
MNSAAAIIPSNLTSQLHEIGLRALPANLDDFLARATEGGWSPQTLLEKMAHAEGEDLYRRRLARRIQVSGIKIFKPMAD